MVNLSVNLVGGEESCTQPARMTCPAIWHKMTCVTLSLPHVHTNAALELNTLHPYRLASLRKTCRNLRKSSRLSSPKRKHGAVSCLFAPTRSASSLTMSRIPSNFLSRESSSSGWPRNAHIRTTCQTTTNSAYDLSSSAPVQYLPQPAGL